jgi:hypothetical protein
MKRKPTKTIEFTAAEHRVITAIVNAIQFGGDVVVAAQRAEERNNDVKPVAEGSEEELIIWGNITDLFQKIRLA